jgi:hypothetical protein
LDIDEFSLALRRRLEGQLTLSHPIFGELFLKGRNWPLLKILTFFSIAVRRPSIGVGS